jgi:hypothetical protein
MVCDGTDGGGRKCCECVFVADRRVPSSMKKGVETREPVGRLGDSFFFGLTNWNGDYHFWRIKHHSRKGVDCAFFHYFYDFFGGVANFRGVKIPKTDIE